MSEILLGTVAIEPNRWGTITADRAPVVRVADWIAAIDGAGFDGLEIWDGHVTAAPDGDVDRLRSVLPLALFNSYADFGPGDDAARSREAAAEWTARCGSRAVKFNVGNDPADEQGYVERLASWIGELPGDTAAMCECHQGISIAEDPLVAARMFDQVGPADRLQALVHTHDAPDLVRAKFDAYGDRITHVHVNFLDFTVMTHPRLGDVVERLGEFHRLVTDLGFRGSWTLEFVAGLLTEDDTPAVLVEQATADLTVLREVLAG